MSEIELLTLEIVSVILQRIWISSAYAVKFYSHTCLICSEEILQFTCKEMNLEQACLTFGRLCCLCSELNEETTLNLRKLIDSLVIKWHDNLLNSLAKFVQM